MKPFVKESGFEKLILILCCFGSLLLFGVFYEQHLSQREQLQLFELSSGYFLQKISHHGGFADCAGEFLIQFFHLPFAGAVIITALFLLLCFQTRWLIYRISGKLPAILFTVLPATGYLILLLDDFYCISGLAGLILALAAVMFYISLKSVKLRSTGGIILIPLIYWLTGGAYLVFVSLIIIHEFMSRPRSPGNQYITIPVILSWLVLAVGFPLLGREYIFNSTLLQAFMSGSYYRISIFFPIPLVILFILFPLLTLHQYFIPEIIRNKMPVVYKLVTLILLSAFTIAGIANFGDFKTEVVMTYENLACKEKWYEIIKRAEKEPPDDPVSMVAVNLALAKRGDLSEKMFHFDQGANTLFIGYERRGMTPFITGEPYYQLGLYNFAQMFAMETIESTPDAKYPVRSFKRMAETFIINGQYDIARKYLQPLSRTIFYRRWAKNCMEIIKKDKNSDVDPSLKAKRDLMPDYDFFYNIDQIEVALRYLLISNPGNKTAYEYLMAYYLLQKDLDGFLMGMQLAEGLDYTVLPAVWQEAAAYIGTRVQQIPPVLTKYKIDREVTDRLILYARAFSVDNRDTLKIREEFGRTYWYYLHFK